MKRLIKKNTTLFLTIIVLMLITVIGTSYAVIRYRLNYNNEVVELGCIESLSTAYPISFTKDAIWAGDNTAIRKYTIKKGELVEAIDDSDDYLASQVIHFGCGASDCINSIIIK